MYVIPGDSSLTILTPPSALPPPTLFPLTSIYVPLFPSLSARDSEECPRGPGETGCGTLWHTAAAGQAADAAGEGAGQPHGQSDSEGPARGHPGTGQGDVQRDAGAGEEGEATE